MLKMQNRFRSDQAETKILRSSAERPAWETTIEDVKDAWHMRNLWLTLGTLDVKRRYRRTLLGPFWASGHILLYILCVGFVFSTLLEKDRATYIPFLTTGILPWMLVYNIFQEAGGAFSGASSLRQQLPFPYAMFVFQTLLRNIYVHAHNYVLFLLMMIFYPVELNASIFLLIPGYILVFANLFWICMLLATVAARYRDVQQLIAAVIQVMIFLTPIFYSADKLTEFQQTWLVTPNLLYHLTVVIRSPLLGEVPPLSSYLILTIALGLGSALTAWYFGRRRSQIVYWIM